LLHISKLGGGKRIDRVEDVLNLGDEVEVRVDDIDNSGKLSLSLAGAEGEAAGGGDSGGGSGRGDSGGGSGGGDSGGESGGDDRPPRRERPPRARGGDSDSGGNGGSRERSAPAKVASFEDQWENQAREEFGDLGPADAARTGSGGGGGPRRGGGGGGRGRGGRGGGGGRR
jgi:polyribonucleotide nucleotidyltransferase